MAEQPLSQEMVEKIKQATEDKFDRLRKLPPAERRKEIERYQRQHDELVKRQKER